MLARLYELLARLCLIRAARLQKRNGVWLDRARWWDNRAWRRHIAEVFRIGRRG